MAFCDWEQVTDIEFTYMGINPNGIDPNDNRHTIGFTDLNDGGRVAQTDTNIFGTCVGENDPCIYGRLDDADIVFDSNIFLKDTEGQLVNLGWYVSTQMDIPQKHLDFYSVLIHEIGHAILLEHSMDPPLNGTGDDRIMFYKLDPLQIKRNIDQKTINGIEQQKATTLESIANGCLSEFILNCNPSGCIVANHNLNSSETIDIKVNNLISCNEELNLESSEKIKDIFLYNLSGRFIGKWDNINNHNFSANFNYEAGMYLLNIRFDNGISTTEKIICYE